MVRHYDVREHGEFISVLERFLEVVAAEDAWRRKPEAACLAVACAVEGAVMRFTNSFWTIDHATVSERLGGVPLEFINDFAAVGHAITDLHYGDWHQIGGGEPFEGRPIAVLGPGTGLGVCALVPIGGGYRVIEGEGGHADFAPVDAGEMAVLEILNCRFGRVSVERLLSGGGIVNIYQALAQLSGKPAVHKVPAHITRAATGGSDILAVRTLNMFCGIMGSVAGNLILTLGAKGGLYIAGGIVPRFIPYLERSGFRHRLEAKGRFSDYLAAVPARIVIKPHLGLYGAVKKLKITEP